MKERGCDVASHPSLIIEKISGNGGKVWLKMSKSEDYLEQLLKGVSPEEEAELGLDTLEEDIFGDVDFDETNVFGEEDFLDEDFLKEFDLEAEKMGKESEETGEEEDILSLFDNVDSILNGAKEQMDTVDVPVSKEVSEPEVTEEQNAELEALLGAKEPAVSEESAAFEVKEPVQQGDMDVLKMLEGLGDIDLELDDEDTSTPDGAAQDFSSLEGFLAASSLDNSMGSSDMEAEELSLNAEAAEETDKKSKKKEKKQKKSSEKTGFWSKLGLILFGEDDDEEKKEIIESDLNEITEIELDEESMAAMGLFGDNSERPAAGAKEEPKKEKKKKEKKEKVKKEKKEKVKKEKPPKPKKEKKPKPPKEPDNTPPLPKKPEILIFLMVASVVALVLIGSDLLGYSNQMADAQSLYIKQNYTEAFTAISGMEIKEEDEALYQKYRIMALVAGELEAHESLMQAGVYDMALDSLVRAAGRAEKYRADAEMYGCIQELNELALEAEEKLSQDFGISREEALELYLSRSKKEYSVAIEKVIEELGLEKVAE